MAVVAAEARTYFLKCGREFPWREERNPYRLAVAEILLQKTRAESVVPTYYRLLDDYPTSESLARAEHRLVASMLEPLGLNQKRASLLIGMARSVELYGESAFANWRFMLREIPGLGTYAARAIACFALGESVGIVDANVARILRRVFRIRKLDVRAEIFQRYADEIANRSEDIRATNFGLLDIGATICLPNPKCNLCPFAGYCPRYGVARLRGVRWLTHGCASSQEDEEGKSTKGR